MLRDLSAEWPGFMSHPKGMLKKQGELFIIAILTKNNLLRRTVIIFFCLEISFIRPSHVTFYN